MKKFDDMVCRKEWVWHFSKFDKDQLYEMNMGVMCGLSLDQINLYADPEMPYLCMRLIKECFQELMPIEQVSLFADRKFLCLLIESLAISRWLFLRMLLRKVLLLSR